MDMISPVSGAKKLGEQAYEKLRSSIITLQLEPGKAIFENEIAALLNISRTPIRDAFHLLLSEGLIEVLPQRTKQVATISELKVKESAFIRLSLESSAFKLVAKQWEVNDQHKKAEKQINYILQEQREAAEQQDIIQFLQFDEAFHRIILQLAGNQTLLDMVYHMRGHLDRFRYLAMKELVLTNHLIEEHEELFESLKKQDEKRVEELLRQHMGKLEIEIPRLRDQFTTYFAD